MYKDKDKQKQANKEASRRNRDKNKGMTKKPVIDEIKNAQDALGCENSVIPDASYPVKRHTVIPTVIPAVIPEKYITDAVGKQHRIDFEGRRKDMAALCRWAIGDNCTLYQQRLGTLALQYTKINKINLPEYLGCTTSTPSQTFKSARDTLRLIETSESLAGSTI